MSVGTTYQQVLDFQYVYSLVVWSIYDVFFSVEIMKDVRKEVFPSPFLFLVLSLLFPSQMTSSCFSQNIFYKYPFPLDMWQRICCHEPISFSFLLDFAVSSPQVIPLLSLHTH